jgi:uncharacterized sulfatase
MLFGFRGRMDERIDAVRSATDGRYVYIRNFMPHRIYGQYIGYMFEMPTARVWKQQYDNKQLGPPRTFFWEPKPPEELYDLQSDPDEVKNLAASVAHRQVLERMRKRLHDWMLEIRDVGLLPENEILSRAVNGAPYTAGHDRSRVPLERILDTAEAASSLDPKAVKLLVGRLGDADSAVRYWAALGLQMRGAETVKQSREALRKLLVDPAPAPRIAAAEAIGRFGNEDDSADAVKVLSELAPPVRSGSAVSILAMNALTTLGRKAEPALAVIRSMDPKDPKSPERLQEYPKRLIEKLTADLS